MAMRKRTLIPLLIALAVIAIFLVAVIVRKEAPPEAARLLPESDAILYLHLKPVRAVTHFDRSPAERSPELQSFIDATGIVPERDIDSAAFALHRVPVAASRYDPAHAELFMSEVFVGRFDGQRLLHYLDSIATARESYAGRTVYSVPMGDQTLRIAQLGYDTVAASNMPTSEQIHSMLDRSRTSALATPGCSLLAARFHEVPLLAEAWGIGHIGLPFSQQGQINAFGLTLPMAADTDLVASLRYTTSAKLRIEEFAPDATSAAKTVEAISSLTGIVRGISAQQQQHTPEDDALMKILDSVQVEQHQSQAVVSASATADQLKAFSAH